MKKILYGLISGILLMLLVPLSLYAQASDVNAVSYKVKRVSGVVKIDAKWNKAQWRRVKPIEINHFMGEVAVFQPRVQAKMMYDDNNVYIIFRVADKYVRSMTTDINGPVWKDSAVEFFFAPDMTRPNNYFNLEINCGGTALLGYHSGTTVRPSVEDVQQIEIAHSLPVVVDPEITGPVTWTLEYRIPIGMLRKYSIVTNPGKGVVWKANFYKIAENNSNPHYASWSIIDRPKPNFHLPQFFGYIEFH